MSREGKEKDQITKFKWMTSIHKECRWLEEMAAQGYFLQNMTMGCYYTFSKGEPKRMCYDVDQFSLSKNPTLEEIHQKEMFLEMAAELGWKEVTHDETQTYYFAKEYEEGGINELHTDRESRSYRAVKIKNMITSQTNELLGIALLNGILDFILQIVFWGDKSVFVKWYNMYVVGYFLFVLGYYFMATKLGERINKELSMTREEWEKQNDKSLYKKECKIILTVRGLRRYLNRRQRQGWILTGVTASTYIFRKGDGEACVYTMDSQSLTNKRWKEKQKKFKDKKDWYGLNNDWQTQSLADAAEKGWNFICALENRSIIYCGKQSEVQPLNDAKYDKSLRSVSALGSFVMFLVCCALVGGVIGAALAMLGF